MIYTITPMACVREKHVMAHASPPKHSTMTNGPLVKQIDK